jgi:hypothetical protein
MDFPCFDVALKTVSDHRARLSFLVETVLLRLGRGGNTRGARSAIRLVRDIWNALRYPGFAVRYPGFA